MRVKDELKQDALFNATVKLVNEIGFVASSVSKIAKEADISPATIYVYYENSPEQTDYFTEEEIQKLAISKVDEKIVKLFLATM